MTRARRILLLPFLLQPLPGFADEAALPEDADEEVPVGRPYETSAEQREAGLKHQVTSWLTAAFLLELDVLAEKFEAKRNGSDDTSRKGNATLQLNLTATPWESVKGELVLEYETDTDDLIADEAFLALELDPWDLEGGKLYTPFGAYISHFATGPILEFGETRTDGVILSLGAADEIDISLAAYRGDARKVGSDPGRWDWVAAIEAAPTESLNFGVSYQSDLADADSRLLEDEDDRFERKVPGLSGYVSWSAEGYGVSFEALGATRSFRELDPDRDHPLAWNLEFVHYLHDDFEWALRLEGSRELEDEPELQFGVSTTWGTGRYARLTVEYLHGRFKGYLATNDDEEPYDHVNRVAAQLAITF